MAAWLFCLADVLADVPLIPDIVEEALRYGSPVQHTSRSVLTPVVLPSNGVLDEGNADALTIVGAGRDPLVFEDPSHFDSRRPNARRPRVQLNGCVRA